MRKRNQPGCPNCGEPDENTEPSCARCCAILRGNTVTINFGTVVFRSNELVAPHPFPEGPFFDPPIPWSVDIGSRQTVGMIYPPAGSPSIPCGPGDVPWVSPLVQNNIDFPGGSIGPNFHYWKSATNTDGSGNGHAVFSTFVSSDNSTITFTCSPESPTEPPSMTIAVFLSGRAFVRTQINSPPEPVDTSAPPRTDPQWTLIPGSLAAWTYEGEPVCEGTITLQPTQTPITDMLEPITLDF